MKSPVSLFCLLAALALPALFFALRPSAEIPVAETAPAASPAKAAAPVAPSARPADTTGPGASPVVKAPTQAETIRQFVGIMDAWENASGLEGDRLEERLRDLITEENAESILRAVPSRFHGTYVGNLLLARWAAQDRGGALQWLAARDDSPTVFEVNAVTKDWILQDSGGLQRYLDALPASAWKSLVLESAGRDALTHDDPEQAFQLLKGMNDSPAKVPLLANAVQQWAEWDPRSAVAEIDKLPDPAARERLILAVASGYAMASPDAAADWLRQSFADGLALDRGLAGVMQAWVSTGDPAAAVQWVTNLPAGPTRDHAFQGLIAAWKEVNPRTLDHWMGTLSDGSLRTQAAATLGSLASAP